MKNEQISTVTYNDNVLTDQEMQENYDWIKNYKPRDLDGTDCPAVNPFIFIYCYLFDASVIHNYYGNEIKYENTEKTSRIVTFRSSSYHFWLDGVRCIDKFPIKKK